ncbi:ABC transporter permease [Anaerosalibacter sp. Marseille-P3206]|uniref:ABC transporter permease n=1 Tax=Anaerosalibacter sp. Marseille-P3206 TaxID=1871005 RepID=UPI000987509E|nr:ABC transporter permease [Anaerosalibacter sp. Marseille-P3206]
MFGKIFFKELKYQFTSLTIIILIVSTFLFYDTQFIGDLKRDWVKPISPRTDTKAVEEKKEYEAILKEDKVTNSYARLFADYIGIGLGFFMVFVTAFTLVRDKRYGSNELIYTREVSSLKYVGGKYLADVITALIIVLVVAGHATWLFHGFSKLTGDSISYTAFYKYTILWILPTIMFVASLSYVLQVVFDNGIVPIIIQFIYWMYSIDIHNNQITKYIIRFNEIAPYSQFQPLEHTIFVNRIFYTLLSIVLLFVAVKLWDRKRGKF